MRRYYENVPKIKEVELIDGKWAIATELIKGKPIDDALKLTNKAVVEALDGLPAVKLHCSVLAEQAIKSALSDYYSRQGVDPVPIVGEIGECEHCH